MRIKTLLKNDIKFQWQNNIYFIYLIVSIVYMGILYFVPKEFKKSFFTFIIISDTSMLGLFFIGAISLKEKEDGILNALFITPIKTGEYLKGKIISFLIMTSTFTLLIYIVARIKIDSLFLFFINLFLSVIFYTLCGLNLGLQSKSINDYLYKLILYFFVLVLPFSKYLFSFDTIFYYLIPTKNTLFLIEDSFSGNWTVNSYYSIFYYIILIFIMDKICKKTLKKIGGKDE